MIRWKLLAKYLAQEADSKEEAKVRRWMNKNKNNLKYFEEIKMYWNQIENTEIPNIDTQKAWNKLKGRIEEHEKASVSQETPVVPLHKKVLRYAAVALLAIGLGTAAFFSYQKINQTLNTVTVYTTDNIQNKKIILPDGSVAYLNYNSRLNYPKEFSNNKRSVNIRGEVYFEVHQRTSQPFVISAKNAEIEVLGTTFNVNDRLPGKKVEVLVNSGKVKLKRKKHTSQYIIVEPGYKGIIHEKSIEKEKNTDQNYLAWQTGRLIFRGQKLQAVAETLTRTYNAQISLEDPNIENYRITTHFTNESIDTVLAVIAATFNLRVDKIEDDEYVIKDNPN